MRKLFLILAFVLMPLVAEAQIAFDAVSSMGVGFSAGGCTASHTTGGGSNRIMFVTATSVEDQIDIATYNGDPLTLIAKARAGSDLWNYMYYMVAPDTGTANVILSNSGFATFTAILCYAITYTGAEQTTPIDVYASNTSTSSPASLTVNYTTVTNNAWSVLTSRSDGSALAAGTGANSRNEDDAFGFGIFDSGAALTPAGAKSMQITYTGASNASVIVAAFCPATTGCTAGGGGSPVKMLLTLGIGY